MKRTLERTGFSPCERPGAEGPGLHRVRTAVVAGTCASLVGMPPSAIRWIVLAVAVLLPSGASAQLSFEAVGERALGMAGAFVAVSDDATAVHWNPAGLASGHPVGMTIGWHDFQVGKSEAAAAPGARQGRATLTSIAAWPLGLSYGTSRHSRLVTDANGDLTGESLRLGHVGVTLLQTIVDGLVVGSTLKVLRGGLATGAVGLPTAGEALEALDDLERDNHTAFDLDVAVMAGSPSMRLGLALKNLRSPSFRATTGSEFVLPRQARIGVAVLPADGVTLAMDLDLNTVDLMGDLRRMLAVGGETSVGSRVQVRSGARWNLAGDRDVLGAVGASVSVRRGWWIDGHYARGRSDEAREMGVALRAGF